jgi:FTR1 family protein
MAAFLVTLREGVEAAIIVAILLSYLNQLDRTAERRWVWAGTVSAVFASPFQTKVNVSQVCPSIPIGVQAAI